MWSYISDVPKRVVMPIGMYFNHLTLEGIFVLLVRHFVYMSFKIGLPVCPVTQAAHKIAETVCLAGSREKGREEKRGADFLFLSPPVIYC